MKHLIIVKFKENIWNREDAASREMLADIKKIFNRTKQIEGVHTVNIYENVTPRPNRHDLMIEMEMDPEVLSVYDASTDHQDNHCGSYCDCGRLTAHALEQLNGSIGAGFNTIASQIH